ncbi:MAG: MarR family EPS-associated transcriptional regulator [Desulfobacterales bacterium]
MLDALDSYEITTQRQLSEKSGISLGHVNYVLKGLLKKGLVKIDNFQKSSNKKSYAYMLTPKGLEAKSRLAARFVVSKLKEYSQLQQKIAQRLAVIERKGKQKIVFAGPEIVKEFVDRVINEYALQLTVVGFCKTWEELKAYEFESYDIVLVIDGNPADMKTMAKVTGIPREKLLSLW